MQITKDQVLNIDTLESLIRPKVQYFINSLKGRYKNHVSDLFIESFIVKEFVQIYFEFPGANPENIAYKSCITLFESILERECKVPSNGHHVAQSFCKYFKDIKIMADLKY